MDEPEIDYIFNDTTCNICFAEFLDVEDLKIHGNQVHSVGILDCQFCAQKLRSIEDYAEHIRDTHLTAIKACLYCNRVFMNEYSCRKHEKKHISHSAAKYKCSQCEEHFTNMIGLGKHEYNMHKEGADASRGLWLGNCLPHLSSVLNMNLNSVLAEDKTKFVCTKCRAVSLTLEDYIQHLKNENCRSLSCNSCATVYNGKKGLLKHFNKHSECNYDTKNITKKCGECYKDFPLHYWKYHQKSCKTIKCHLCAIVFEKMDDLSRHQRENHPMVISVEVCKYCQKEFVGKVGLSRHIMRTHNIEQYKYKCVYCEMVYKHPKRLFAHFFTKHKEIEPYYCCLCSKSFKIRKNFTIHIKLVHKSVGSVEFDEKFHVFFKEKKGKPNENNENQNELDATQISENAEAVSEVQTQPVSNSKSEEQTSNFLATDTEAPTDNEMQKDDKPQTKKYREIRSTDVVTTIESSASDSSDDQPLLEIRKKINQQKRTRKRNMPIKLANNRFTCQYCKKQCHTYHKYHNHLNKAHQNVKVKCVKCLKTFRSRKKLVDHIAKEHSSSKLTETLKKVLAQRCNGSRGNHISADTNNLTLSEKFQKTIKKVDCGCPEKPAILKSNSKEISVQKFIESFTPESLETKKNMEISNNVTIKSVCGPTKSSFIKLTKFEPKPNKYRNFRSGNKLAMPLKFKDDRSERTTVTVKVVQVAPQSTYITDDRDANSYYDNDNYDHNEEVIEEKHDQIPEVAQEVMLEGSVEVPKPRMHKVVIPNIPKDVGQVRIATLLPEAPFYRIIKISDVLKNSPNEMKEEENIITLPNGKKLVSVNPLAHLLGDTPIEKILADSKSSKYYQPKRKYNIEQAVAKALMKSPTPKKKRKVTKVEP